jgi:serine protease Do
MGAESHGSLARDRQAAERIKMMRLTRLSVAALLAASLITPFAYTQETKTSNEPFARRNPVVEAVQKTKAGIVAIRVPRPGERDSIGTGLIVDERGLIVTNRHVTGGKKYSKVRLCDGTELTGEVVLSEADLDLALIRIQAQKPLQALRFAPVDDLMVGETVLAIGNPFGYEGTVSRGIISALNREVTMPNDIVMTGLIQHDAPINPGNSGGPLVNINAEVIGINVAMRDGAQNIAFTINANTVKTFLKKYSQQVSRVEAGVKVEEKVIAEVGDRQRVVVKHADHAELQSGDEIRTVGTLKVTNAFDIERALWSKQPGQKIDLTVVRQGQAMTVTLTLSASDGAGQLAAQQ